MSCPSLLVTMICALVIACVIAESQPGSKNDAGAATANNASPEELTAALVAGFSAQNRGVKRNNVAPSVVDSRFANSGHGEREGATESATPATRPPRPSYPTPPQLPPIAETSRPPYPPTQAPASIAYPPTVPVIAETPSSSTPRPVGPTPPRPSNPPSILPLAETPKPNYPYPVQEPTGIPNPPTVPVIAENPLQYTQTSWSHST